VVADRGVGDLLALVDASRSLERAHP
jgi:hypothetical protein